MFNHFLPFASFPIILPLNVFLQICTPEGLRTCEGWR